MNRSDLAKGITPWWGGPAAEAGATLPGAVNGKFNALAQGKTDYVVEVIHQAVPGYGNLMTICASEEAVYITREQAMEFFGLAEPMSDDNAFHRLWTQCVGKPGYDKQVWLAISKQLSWAGVLE